VTPTSKQIEVLDAQKTAAERAYQQAVPEDKTANDVSGGSVAPSPAEPGYVAPVPNSPQHTVIPPLLNRNPAPQPKLDIENLGDISEALNPLSNPNAMGRWGAKQAWANAAYNNSRSKFRSSGTSGKLMSAIGGRLNT
jgi:hypothetical protein